MWFGVHHHQNSPGGCRIKTWRQFGRQVRSGACTLLQKLDKFPNSVLVTGCQRSGTTILSRIITTSDGMENYWFGRDDELDAALILSGRVAHMPRGRCCFQTTYLNECYPEYFQHDNGYRIIWVLRDPYSVVYSIIYHWNRFAFNELFDACGAALLDERAAHANRTFGRWAVPRLRRACLSYNGKLAQVFELVERLGRERIMVVDYADMVKERDRVLARIYQFVDLPYKFEYAAKIHSNSVKKADRLSPAQRDIIAEVCVPVYDRARTLLSDY
jgi:hypothetical protein